MHIDKNSYGSLALVYIIAIIIVVLCFVFIPWKWVNWLILGIAIWFCAWQTRFFTVPNRNVIYYNKDVLSVADGRVIIIDQVYEGEYLKRECKRVCVYMNFFDLHANFWPVEGTVTYYQYHPGKHLLAFRPKTSEDNEHTCTCVRTADGQEIFFKQIAGGFARRIVNYAKPGLSVKAGSQCGIIKFGSRIDLYLPLESEILVSKGDLLLSCVSKIARLS